ncbi:MAG: TonB family protein [Treponema sp.]|jgi:protein TonB|nr:TonB family protein [Treponema sp.]
MSRKPQKEFSAPSFFMSPRAVSFALAAAVHLALLFFAVFTLKTVVEKKPETPEIMKLADIREEAPVISREIFSGSTDSIAENMIEADEVPPPSGEMASGEAAAGEVVDFLPMHLVSYRPEFSDEEIVRRTVYPPIARRAGIEGTVILELFVDRQGVIRNISILKEDPPGRGFGEAAARAFHNLKGSPALANGEAVASRYRYRYQFRLR